MSWRLDPRTSSTLAKAEDLAGIAIDEAVHLLRLPLCSSGIAAVMDTANRMSRALFHGKGERHFHIGVNASPCPYNCRFCSLAENVGVFTARIEFNPEEILHWAKQGEAEGADALNIMTTGTYGFEKLLELGRFLKDRTTVPLVANTRDISHKEGEQLLDAGFVGAYHALRLGEGSDTPFSPEKRIRTCGVLRDVGLLWMNCVEPVGPEHTPEELARLMLLAREYGAAYSGAMRRINFPGSPFEPLGMITELELARIVAVSRLVMGSVPRAHCTHEPHTASLMAGANLLFPEVGSSPRDSQSDTGLNRGRNHRDCAVMLREMGWDPGLPSNCFDHARAPDSATPPAQDRLRML